MKNRSARSVSIAALVACAVPVALFAEQGAVAVGDPASEQVATAPQPDGTLAAPLSGLLGSLQVSPADPAPAGTGTTSTVTESDSTLPVAADSEEREHTAVRSTTGVLKVPDVAVGSDPEGPFEPLLAVIETVLAPKMEDPVEKPEPEPEPKVKGVKKERTVEVAEVADTEGLPRSGGNSGTTGGLVAAGLALMAAGTTLVARRRRPESA